MSLGDSLSQGKPLFSLWEHQKDGIALFRDAFERDPKRRSILGISPVGSGKGTLASYLLAGASAKGQMACMVAPRREIVADVAERLRREGVDCGILMDGFPPSAAYVQIATQNSLYALVRTGRLDLATFRLFVWDEAHHAVARTYRWLRERAPRAIHVGLTASPRRADGTPLLDVFESMHEIVSVSALMEKNLLAPARIIKPPRYTFGSICADPIAMYEEHLAGERAVHFCKSVEEAEERAHEYNAHGIAAACVHGATPKHVRRVILAQYAAGEIQVVTNYDILTEGWDCPETRGVIITRPYQSDVHWVQSTGRGLRAAAGKSHCTILDLCGNANLFGLPSRDRMPTPDELEPKEKRTRKAGDGVKRCPNPKCRFELGDDASCLRHDADGCPACGFHYEPPVLRLPVEPCALEVEHDGAVPGMGATA